MNDRPRRILVVEDDPGTREALAAAFGARGYVPVGAGSGEEAIACLAAEAVVAAVVDLGLPGMSGEETIRALRGMKADLPVLVLSVFEDPVRVVAAIEAGASGYQVKGATVAELAAALEQVIGGLSPLSPSVATHLLAALRARSIQEPTPGSGLTTRETEVLELLVRGHAYADIAGALAIGLGTVQTHVKSVYRKLEVASKAEATAIAFTRKIVPLPR